VRWINYLIGWKSRQTNQNGRLTVCRFCFNAGPSKELKAIWATWRLFKVDATIPSRMSHPSFRTDFHNTDRLLFGNPHLGDPQNVSHNEVEARNIENFNISTLVGKNRPSLATVQWNLNLTKLLVCLLNQGSLYWKPCHNEFEGKWPKSSLYRGHS